MESQLQKEQEQAQRIHHYHHTDSLAMQEITLEVMHQPKELVDCALFCTSKPKQRDRIRQRYEDRHDGASCAKTTSAMPTLMTTMIRESITSIITMITRCF
jgi:hypothetical protein